MELIFQKIWVIWVLALVATSYINHHVFFNGLGGNLSSNPIVGNTSSFESKNGGGRWQVDFQAQWKNGVEKWKPAGVVMSLWSQNRWLEDENFPLKDAFLSSTILLSGRASFFRLDPSIAGNLSRGWCCAKTLWNLWFLWGCKCGRTWFFFPFPCKRFLCFSTENVICTNPPQLMTSFTKTTPLCGTFFWRRVELSPGSVFVFENADRHDGLILKIPCKTPDLRFKKNYKSWTTLAMWGKKNTWKNHLFSSPKKNWFWERYWNVMTTFLYIKRQLFRVFFGSPIFPCPKKVATSNFQIQNSHHGGSRERAQERTCLDIETNIRVDGSEIQGQPPGKYLDPVSNGR